MTNGAYAKKKTMEMDFCIVFCAPILWKSFESLRVTIFRDSGTKRRAQQPISASSRFKNVTDCDIPQGR